jgi:hypothetical protein
MEKVEIEFEDLKIYLEVLKLDGCALVVVTDTLRRLEHFNVVVKNRFVFDM